MVSMTTHSTAGLMVASGARPDAVRTLGCADAAVYGVQSLQTSSWTKGAIAKPATFPAFHGKNRPPRPSRSAPPG